MLTGHRQDVPLCAVQLHYEAAGVAGRKGAG